MPSNSPTHPPTVDPDQVGIEAAAILRSKHRLTATWEYPGYIHVLLLAGDESLAFGTANGEWGYDHHCPEGININSGLNEVLPLTATAEEVVAYMLKAVAFHHEEHCRRQGGGVPRADG
ncbi:MAG: hypothetical protein PHE83_17410 [Opitutaceae bacterium]|nr:hypothetical protein [Opitutaceae bacterium]